MGDSRHIWEGVGRSGVTSSPLGLGGTLSVQRRVGRDLSKPEVGAILRAPSLPLDFMPPQFFPGPFQETDYSPALVSFPGAGH